MKVIAVGPNAWGKGDTVHEAIENMWPHLPSVVTDAKRGPKPGVPLVRCWLAPNSAYVNEFGGLSWAADDGSEYYPLGCFDRLRKPCKGE